jgi:hypothetical protein
MASIFFKYYAAVEQASDTAVKKEYGVTKANVLKVLEKLLLEDLSSASGKTAPASAAGKRGPKGKRGRGAPKKRGRKPGKLAAKAKTPGRRGRKPGSVLNPTAPKIEVS